VIALADLVAGTRLLARLPALLRRPVTVAEARPVLRRRLEGREADFLRLAKRAIFDHAESPYRQLLERAGCQYGDLVRLVQQDGVEDALRRLLREGVYLTVDEFKGRRPVRRGSASFEVPLRGLRNPGTRTHISGETSGSRGARTPVSIDLAWVRDWAVDECLDAEARGGFGWIHGRWTVPGGGSIAFILMFAASGKPTARWFSPVDPGSSQLHPRYRWAERLLYWGGRLAGVPLPRPEHVPFDAPEPILTWLAETLRCGAVPYLVAYTSGLVRVCEAALDAGIELAGARALAVGEPLTAARLATIRRAGVVVAPIYASVDAGVVGKGCLAAESADEIHLFHDLVTVIQPGGTPEVPVPSRALLLSSLRDTAPLILLNVSLGDQATVTERRCGCPLERLGWTTHLHTIRSFEKLTAGGMTFLDLDLIHVIEEVLPARFGGTAADYQLVESERAGGSPALRLLVHPRVGPVDPRAAIDAFLSAIGGADGQRVMGMMWRDAKLVTVERRPPLTTPSGKILHLHVARGERSRQVDAGSAAT
jgi:hypothetical protein